MIKKFKLRCINFLPTWCCTRLFRRNWGTSRLARFRQSFRMLLFTSNIKNNSTNSLYFHADTWREELGGFPWNMKRFYLIPSAIFRMEKFTQRTAASDYFSLQSDTWPGVRKAGDEGWGAEDTGHINNRELTNSTAKPEYVKEMLKVNWSRNVSL